jgi:hypothetical protein
MYSYHIRTRRPVFCVPNRTSCILLATMMHEGHARGARREELVSDTVVLDSNTMKWTVPLTAGRVPPPRSRHSLACAAGKVRLPSTSCRRAVVHVVPSSGASCRAVAFGSLGPLEPLGSAGLQAMRMRLPA